MAFNVDDYETKRKIKYNNEVYIVIDQASCGLFIAAKENDVLNNNYPLNLVAIPSETDDSYSYN